ncbi:MAG: biopolymer transporter ExbD [Chthoniobacterales bacterium]
MRRYSERNQMHTLTDLNVTPLLDLAFVLLIIFMITTPLIENSVDLVVPTSSAAKSKVNPSDVQIVSIDREKNIELNKVPITVQELEDRLTEMKASNPEIAVVVRPDRNLTVQELVSIMDILDRVHIDRVGMLAHPEDAAHQ